MDLSYLKDRLSVCSFISSQANTIFIYREISSAEKSGWFGKNLHEFVNKQLEKFNWLLLWVLAIHAFIEIFHETIRDFLKVNCKIEMVYCCGSFLNTVTATFPQIFYRHRILIKLVGTFMLLDNIKNGI